MANGTLEGTVVDIRTNQPIDGATVKATPEGGGETHQATSEGSKGAWGPLSVAAGIYDMTVEAQGYAEGIYPGIVVLENVTTTLPFALHPSEYFG